MMQTVENLLSLFIGRENDGKVETVEINCAAWLEKYPHLTDYRIEVTAPNGVVYLPIVTMQDNVLVWEITQGDTAETGKGKYQVVATGADGERKTSNSADLHVLSIMPGTAQDSPPDASKPWTDKVTADAEKAAKAAEKAGKAAVHPPVIGENGNWMLWDFEKGEYTDSGMPSSGGGTGGTITDEQIKEAVDEYLRENPVEAPVQSVNGKTGEVKLTAKDVGALPSDTQIPDPYTLPIASAETLGGMKVGDGLEVNDAGVVSTALAGLSGMRKIAQITVAEETKEITVDLGKLCKACRFIFVFPEKITAAGYVYAQVGSVEELTQNMSGCNVNDVKVMEYIRIAADYRPITMFSTAPMEGNEMAQNIKFGFPYQQYCTYDEKAGFRYVKFSAYQISFPAKMVITILGA